MRGLRRPRSQGRPLRMQSLLPENICRQPRQAPHRGLEGRQMLGDAVHPRLYVQGGNQRARAPVDQPHQGR